jgi:hypothetical protein
VSDKMTLPQAISYLKAHGFLVKGYGFPESESAAEPSGLAETYRVLQGDYDTGMVQPHQLIEVAEQIRRQH